MRKWLQKRWLNNLRQCCSNDVKVHAGGCTRNEENRSKTMETFEQMYDREIAVAMSRRGGLGLAEMIETHLDKINVSSKDILERRFKLNHSYPLEKENKSLELKTGETQTSIPLNRPKKKIV